MNDRNTRDPGIQISISLDRVSGIPETSRSPGFSRNLDIPQNPGFTNFDIIHLYLPLLPISISRNPPHPGNGIRGGVISQRSQKLGQGTGGIILANRAIHRCTTSVPGIPGSRFRDSRDPGISNPVIKEIHREDIDILNSGLWGISRFRKSPGISRPRGFRGLIPRYRDLDSGDFGDSGRSNLDMLPWVDSVCSFDPVDSVDSIDSVDAINSVA